MTTPFINRPPRFQPNLPHNQVEIPQPPNLPNDTQQTLLQLALPLISIIGYVLVSMLGQSRNPVFLIPMALSVMVSVGMSIYTRRKSRAEVARQKNAYREQIVELRRDMGVAHEAQRHFYHHNFPSHEQAMAIADQANGRSLGKTHDEGIATRIWERRTSDVDFGSVRIGTGLVASTVLYALRQGGSLEDELVRGAMRLAEDSLYVHETPIVMQLRPKPDTPPTVQFAATQHAVAIVGANRGRVYEHTNALLTHFSTFHSPTDTELLILGSDKARRQWLWATELPHCSGGRNRSYCFESDRAQAQMQVERVDSFLKNLANVLGERHSRLLDRDYAADVTLPFMLVVVDLLHEASSESRLAHIESDAAIGMLIHRGHELGAAVLFLVPNQHAIPSGCHGALVISESERGYEVERNVSFRYIETGVNTPRFSGKLDLVTDRNPLQAFANHLKPLRVPRSAGAALPNGVLMLDMLGLSTAADFRQAMQQQWQQSILADEADWLKCSLGLSQSGETRTLKYAADADGVHGMVAGSTGSGKSELLMTMILDMAYRYDPSIINFVLVDFKGGGAFKPLEGLPHVVDVVTNLSESAVERMFAAVTAELNRRQAINTNTESKDIVAYRKRGLHETEGLYREGTYGKQVVLKDHTYHTEPYPHLFIIIDEFAEMIASNPEYKEQLNSITRLGRALGVTLILAAQRPTGVTDQMRANIKFRIALRVETREESSEILRRPDAAYLPTGLPGRGYLQIGNENIEMVQVAWCGAEYQGGRSVEQPRVSWPDRPNKARASDEEEFPKVFEMMVDEMVALARKISPHQRKPWPDFLPESMALVARVERAYLSDEHFHWMAEGSEQPFIPLSSTIARWMGDEAGWHPVDWENRAMRVPIGLVDNAYNAEQLPLVADLRRGHMVMFGASGWGKTNFLRTLIVSLSALHSPDEMHVYLLDFGGRQLTLFDALPHVGAIITADEPERVQRLIRFLERQLEMRKRTISAAGADDFYSYNQHNRKTPLPALLICIDNFAELRESYEGLLPRLVSLVRDARANGVHFVGTGEMPNSMGGKLFSLFTERLALKLSDASEYTTIVGRGARNLEEVPGRGFTRVGKRALMFQLALASAEIDDNLTESQQLSKLIQRLSDQTTKQPYTKPASIDILTPYVGLSDLLAQPLPQADVPQPVLGIEDIELQPWCLSLAEHGPHLMIIGPPSSGKTTTLQSLALSLAHAYAPSDVMLVLIDLQARLFNYGGRRQLDELPHVVQVIGNEEELPQFVEHLQSLFTSRAAAREQGCPVYVLIDNYDSFSEEAEALRSTGILRTLGKMARTFGSDGLHFVIAGSMGMPRDPLRKQVAASRFGLSMQSAEGAQNLNARIPGSMLRMELPIGRGFCVRAGRPFLLQVAAPFAADDPVPAALDRWIGQISSQRSEPRNRWPEIMTEAPDATELEIEQLQPQSNVAQVRSTINAQQLEALCAELLKHGYPDSILKLMEPNDVIKIAMEHGLMKEAAV